MNKERPVTRHLSTQQARALVAAFDHAREVETPLNTHVTIHWSATLQMSACVPERIQLLIERMRHWLQRRGIPVCHIWAQEPSSRRHEFNDVPHLHMLVHVPHLWREAFDSMLPEWVDGIGCETAVKVVGVQAQHWRWRGYLPKGVNPLTRDEELRRISTGKKARTARGLVEGKRCGFSQNTLGPAARAQWQRQQRQRQQQAQQLKAA